MMTTAQQRMVEDNLGLATAAARKMFRHRDMGSYVDFETMLSASHLGLCKAALRFDPKHGASFGTYAWRRCCGEILDEVRRLDAQTSLRTRAERESYVPSYLVGYLDNDLPLRSPDGGGPTTYHDIVGDPRTVTEDIATDRQVVAAIDELLSEREAYVVRMSCLHGEPLRVAGETLGVTEGRAHQIRAAGFAKLRPYFEENR